MTLLPICVMIGDYQWVKFTIMNIVFYSITAIEIDKYLYLLNTNTQMHEVLVLNQKYRKESIDHKILYRDLTRREMEIVSKHASNIFKKTGTRNKSDFVKRFL